MHRRLCPERDFEPFYAYFGLRVARACVDAGILQARPTSRTLRIIIVRRNLSHELRR